MFSRCAFAVSSRAAVRCNKVKAAQHATTITSAQYSSISSIDTAERTKRLLDAKAESGMSYDDLSNKLGLTNTYTAQLLLGQAKLTPKIAIKLQEALPSVQAKDISDMQSSFPMRSFDDEIMKEPNVYRTYEAITHVSPTKSYFIGYLIMLLHRTYIQYLLHIIVRRSYQEYHK